MNKKLPAAVLSLFCAAAFAGANEIVVLKGGKALELSRPYVVRGSQAVMTLKDGTVVSVAASDIDLAATRAARTVPNAAPQAPVSALTPVEAARAQQNQTRARVKIGDSDVGHVLLGAEGEGEGEGAAAGGAEGEAGGDAKVDVVDFEQKPSGTSVAVTGTVRNSGKATAQNVALSIAAIDDAGKTVASTTAAVSAGSLDAGSTATFTATLPMAAKAGTLRFTPRWSSPAAAARPDATGTAASAAPATAAAAPGTPAGPATAPAPAKPATPPPAPEKKEPTYKPQPDYAPPPANAPMAPTGDIHTGYIPGAHEETPPPPPPPPAN